MLNKIYNIIRDTPKLNYLTHKIIFFLEGTALFNFLYYEYIKIKIRKSLDGPSQICFSVTKLCNADCIMCPIKKYREISPSDNRFMSLELLTKVVKEAKKTVKQVIFTGGEPLLDTTLFEKIKFTKENLPEVSLKIFTNGSLLHKNDNIKKFVSSPVDDITISLDATTKEEYEKVRKDLSFDQLIKNIKELYELKQKESPNKILRLSVLALKANEKSHKDFFDKMKGYADILEITNPHNFGGFVDVEVKNAYRVKKRYPCYYFWSRLTVFPDGIVSICGDDFLNEYVAGNLYEQTVEEIWKSKAFEKARELHLKEEFGKIKICKDCTSHYFWWKKIGD